MSDSNGQSVVQVDAFTDTPFRGNPAAVCLLDEERDERWMQQVAREMNLSETAFLLRRSDHWALRWFTPVREVDLCGHATLASAHVLFEDGHVERSGAIAFETRSGRLVARSSGGWIEMDFPAQPPRPVEPPQGLLSALGLSADDVVYAGENGIDLLVAVADEAAVRGVAPDFTRLAAVDARGVMVTAPADDERWDFVSRYFAPAFGVPEDPVTGSAHCCLGPYWAGRLDRSELVACQVSERGGEVRVRCEGDRVMLRGRAVTVLRGTLEPAD